MAYTPINWQTGDTITAEKMNKMDNGWGVSNTQLFSGSLTVESDGEPIETNISASDFSSATNAVVSIGGTEYACVGFDDSGFWTFGAPYGDFSTYPFSFYESGSVYFNHQTAGTYQVSFFTVSYEVSNSFKGAVMGVVNNLLPLDVVIGSTTWQEVKDALNAGRVAAIVNGSAIEYVVGIQEFTIKCISISGSSLGVSTYFANDANSPLYAS